jgi:RNA polymerase sigma-70 factor (ECF subfamily)
MSHAPQDEDGPRDARQMATTHWSVVLAAGDVRRPDAREALSTLCEAYWYPVYAYARRRAANIHEAQDITQEFFTHLVEKNTLAAADPARGRFRAFLLTALKNFLANEWHKARAQKRGGGRAPVSLDFPSGEIRFGAAAATGDTPEKLFDREWTVTLLDDAVARLQAEYAAKGKEQLFEVLKAAIVAGQERIPFAEAAQRLGMTENAAQVAAHRLRKRYRELIRERIANTVADPGEIDDEIRWMIAILAAE